MSKPLSHPDTIAALEDIYNSVTDRQREYIDALKEHGTVGKAARALGCSRGSIQEALGRALQRSKSTFPGYNLQSDLTQRPIDEPWRLGKTTIQRSEAGIERVWERFSPDEDARIKAILDYIDARSEGITPLKPVPAPRSAAEQLCNLYVMTDCHVGMLAWGKENRGQPWDIKIATECLTGCFQALLDQSPAAEVGVISQLGDWMHVDKVEPLTPASGHILDADIRFRKIVSAALDILEWFVTQALKKHKRVVLVIAEGNHDPVSAVWMRVHFGRLFRDNPRVTIIDEEAPYYAYQHGKVMLAFHHGHKRRPADLPLLFASREPAMWGATKYRYGHSGHYHNQVEFMKEYNGMKWRQHPTLASPDSYAERGGWMSKREASAITYHSEYGQVGEVTVSPDMLAS